MTFKYPLYGITGASGDYSGLGEFQMELYMLSGISGIGTYGYVLTDLGDGSFQFLNLASGVVGEQGPVGPTGEAGPSGQGFEWGGEWDVANLYPYYTVVEHEGSSFISTGDPQIGEIPQENSLWDLMAASGERGADGAHTGYASTGEVDGLGDAYYTHAGDTTIHFTEESLDLTGYASTGYVDGLGENHYNHADDATIHFTTDHAHTGYATTGDLDVHAGTDNIHFADAAANNRTYARKNNAWETIVAEGLQNPLTGHVNMDSWHFMDGVQEVLFWSGSPENRVYIGGNPAFSVTETSLTAGDFMYYDGAEWVNRVALLNDLSNVVLVSPVSGEALVFDGAEWVNQAPGAAGAGITGDSKGAHIPSPTASENRGLFRFNKDITPNEVCATIVGAPSDDAVVHFNLLFGPDRGTPASGLFASYQATTSTGSADSFTSFEHSTIAAGDHLVFATTGATANIEAVEIFLYYSES